MIRESHWKLFRQETADHILDEASSRRVLDYIDFTETGIIRRDQDYPPVRRKFCKSWNYLHKE